LDAVTQAPQDAIFKTKSMYDQDTYENKVNLGIGAYRTDDGKPWPLPSVKAAERLIIADSKLNMEYLPITGHAGFLNAACAFLMGNDYKGLDKIAKCQAISGTGALRLPLTSLRSSSRGNLSMFLTQLGAIIRVS